jgi:hypothetical protein
MVARLAGAGLSPREQDGGLQVRDPSGNTIVMTTPVAASA